MKIKACIAFFRFILLIICTSEVSAITLREKQIQEPWETYQGDAWHTGYVPIHLDFSGKQGEPVAAYQELTSNPLPAWHPITHFHGDWDFRVFENDDDDDFDYREWLRNYNYYFALTLNQPTYKDGMLWVSSRGFRVPFKIFVYNFQDFAPSVFYDLSLPDADLPAYAHYWDWGYPSNFDDFRAAGGWPEANCPVSQAQITAEGETIYFATNTFDYGGAQDCDVEGNPSTRYSRFHFIDYYRNKDEDGREKFEFHDSFAPIGANQNDNIWAATIANDSVYLGSGGDTDNRNLGGMYSFTLDGLNRWPASGDSSLPEVFLFPEDPQFEYRLAGPNDQWTPAVTQNYAVGYTVEWLIAEPNIQPPEFNDQPIYNRLGQVTVRDPESGQLIGTILDPFYEPAIYSKPFHAELAPTILNEHYAYVANPSRDFYGRLTKYNLLTLEKEREIFGAFRGQVSASPNIVYAVNGEHIAAYRPQDLADIPSSDTGRNWRWPIADRDEYPIDSNEPRLTEYPLESGESIEPPFIVTDSHLIVSTRKDNEYYKTYAVAIESRAVEWEYGEGGALSMGFNMLFIANSASWSDLEGRRLSAAERGNRPGIDGDKFATPEDIYIDYEFVEEAQLHLANLPISTKSSANLKIETAIDCNGCLQNSRYEIPVGDTFSVEIWAENFGELTVNKGVVRFPDFVGLELVNMPAACKRRVREGNIVCTIGAMPNLNPDTFNGSLQNTRNSRFTLEFVMSGVGLQPLTFTADSEQLDINNQNRNELAVYGLPTEADLAVSLTPLASISINAVNTLTGNISNLSTTDAIGTRLKILSNNGAEIAAIRAGSTQCTFTTQNNGAAASCPLGDIAGNSALGIAIDFIPRKQSGKIKFAAITYSTDLVPDNNLGIYNYSVDVDLALTVPNAFIVTDASENMNINIANAGADNASGVVLDIDYADGFVISEIRGNGIICVIKTVPAQCALPDIAAGDSVQYTVFYQGSPQNNSFTLEVNSAASDSKAIDNRQTRQFSVDADMILSVSDTVEFFSTDEVIPVEITNGGEDRAFDISFEPSVVGDAEITAIAIGKLDCPLNEDEPTVCAVGELAPGETVTANVAVRSFGPSSIFSFSTESSSIDPDDSNNAQETQARVAADLGVTVVGDMTLVDGEDQLNIRINNNGPHIALDTQLSILLDGIKRVLNVSSEDAAINCDFSIQPVVCGLGNIGPDTGVNLLLSLEAGTGRGTVTLTAATTAEDDNSDNDKARYEFSSAIDLVTRIDNDNPVVRSQASSESITITNEGTDTAIQTELVARIPAGVMIEDYQTEKGECSVGGGMLVCTIGAMAAGESVTVDVTFRAVSGSSTLRFEARSARLDLQPENNSTAFSVIESSSDSGGGGGLPLWTLGLLALVFIRRLQY